MNDRELFAQAVVALEYHTQQTRSISNTNLAIEALRARLAQPEPQEIKIEFKEWLHPQMGVVPVDPKTPLILKAVIREEL